MMSGNENAKNLIKKIGEQSIRIDERWYGGEMKIKLLPNNYIYVTDGSTSGGHANFFTLLSGNNLEIFADLKLRSWEWADDEKKRKSPYNYKASESFEITKIEKTHIVYVQKHDDGRYTRGKEEKKIFLNSDNEEKKLDASWEVDIKCFKESAEFMSLLTSHFPEKQTPMVVRLKPNVVLAYVCDAPIYMHKIKMVLLDVTEYRREYHNNFPEREKEAENNLNDLNKKIEQNAEQLRFFKNERSLLKNEQKDLIKQREQMYY